MDEVEEQEAAYTYCAAYESQKGCRVKVDPVHEFEAQEDSPAQQLNH